jgi:hypothetical protein
MPDTPDEIAALTDAAAANPMSATVDGRSATAQRLADLIELEKWRANQAAAAAGSSGLGIRFVNTQPPGAVGCLAPPS